VVKVRLVFIYNIDITKTQEIISYSNSQLMKHPHVCVCVCAHLHFMLHLYVMDIPSLVAYLHHFLSPCSVVPPSGKYNFQELLLLFLIRVL
jgi:hypothetical protein